MEEFFLLCLPTPTQSLTSYQQLSWCLIETLNKNNISCLDIRPQQNATLGRVQMIFQTTEQNQMWALCAP